MALINYFSSFFLLQPTADPECRGSVLSPSDGTEKCSVLHTTLARNRVKADFGVVLSNTSTNYTLGGIYNMDLVIVHEAIEKIKEMY